MGIWLFPLFAVNNIDLTCMREHVFSVLLGICLGVELLDHVVLSRLTWEKLANALHPGGPVWRSQQQWRGFAFFRILANRRPLFRLQPSYVGEKWCLTAVLICSSSTINGVEHLSVHVLTIYMSPSEKCLFKSCARILIGSLVFFIVELFGCQTYVTYMICKHFLPSSK